MIPDKETMENMDRIFIDRMRTKHPKIHKKISGRSDDELQMIDDNSCVSLSMAKNLTQKMASKDPYLNRWQMASICKVGDCLID